MMKACLQVDLDGLWTYRRYGKKRSGETACIETADPVFTQGVPLFLELFHKYGVKATFFAAGCDARNRKHAGILRQIAEQGHEIASHSQTHPRSFSFLGREEIRAQIKESRHILEDVCQTKISGFRAPAFSINAKVLNLLEEERFLYDASLIPSFLNPLFLKIAHSLMSGRLNRDDMGSFKAGLACRGPYLPDRRRILKKGDMSLVEVPIGVLPFLRLPMHSSYVYLLGEWLFDLGLALYKRGNTPFCYLFHGIDLIDWKEHNAGFPGGRNTGKRRRIAENIVCKIKENAAILTTRGLAEEFSPEKVIK